MKIAVGSTAEEAGSNLNGSQQHEASNGGSSNDNPLSRNSGNGAASNVETRGNASQGQNGLNASFPVAGTSDAFDLSSYDPLQAHAFQLAASAGLASMPYNLTLASGPIQYGGVMQQQQQQTPKHDQQGEQSQQQQLPPYYFFTQPQAGAYAQPAPIAMQHMGMQAPNGNIHSQAVDATVMAAQPQQFYTGTNDPTVAHVAAPQMQQTQYLQPAYTTNMPTLPQGALSLMPNILSPFVPSTVVSNQNKRPSTLDRAITEPAHKKYHYANGVPSVISASTYAASECSATSGPGSESMSAQHHKHESESEQLPSNWATMAPQEKRRHDRNMREQQRSYKITQQIKELRVVLTESSVPFKPNKFSILISVVDYIKQLQARAIMLDAEHRKLVNTIRQTTDIVNSGQTVPDASLSSNKESVVAPVGNDAELLFVQGLDYHAVFNQCSAPLGVAALDGRILACNSEFEAVLGCSRDELLRQSLFNLMQNQHEVFKAMGEMLKGEDMSPSGSSTDSESPGKLPLYWSGLVSKRDQHQLFMNITLTRTPDGIPKFFNFALKAT